MLAVSTSEEISSWKKFRDEAVVDEWVKYKNKTKRLGFVCEAKRYFLAIVDIVIIFWLGLG